MPAVMVGDGGLSPMTPGTSVTPGSAGAAPVTPAARTPGGRFRSSKPILALIAAAVVLIGVLIWYFGYYTNPSVVYRQSLSRTGKGYDKLVDFVDKQQTLASNGYSGDGTYNVKVGDFSTDGKIAYKGNGKDTDLTFDVGLEATRINADIRTIHSSGATPDVYVKATNIKGLGTVLGLPDMDANLAKLDDTWIVIDHTFIDNLSGLATDQADATKYKGPTHDQVLDEARAFGRVNQQYLFSTDKNRAVTRVVKSYGTEKVDGRKTYHYKIAFRKENVKKYIYAQRDALKASKLNDWLKQNHYDKDVYASFNDSAASTKDIKASDTYDVWMDASQRIVYKIRFPDKTNPAENYADVGLDYKGGDSFPFFISGKFKDSSDKGTFSFVTTLNTKTSDTAFKFDMQASGTDGGNITASMHFKPNTTPPKIATPTGAKQLSEALSDLGLSGLLNGSSSSSSGAGGANATDVSQLQTAHRLFNR